MEQWIKEGIHVLNWTRLSVGDTLKALVDYGTVLGSSQVDMGIPARAKTESYPKPDRKELR